MTEELVKDIARAAAKAYGNFNYDGFNAQTRDKFDRIARAVIPVVLEAAAKVADADEGRTIYGNSDYGPNVSIRIAAAIRNLGSRV